MNGVAIRINESYSPELEKGGDLEAEDIGFAQLFSPILDYIAKLHWVVLHYESSPFASGMAIPELWRREEELRMDVDGVHPDPGVQLYSPPALQEFADFVRNDWQDFLGVKRERDPFAATRRFVTLDERADICSGEWTVDFSLALEEETELVFFSNDARTWEMYAAEGRIISSIYNTCRGFGGLVRVRKLDLGQREIILSERW